MDVFLFICFLIDWLFIFILNQKKTYRHLKLVELFFNCDTLNSMLDFKRSFPWYEWKNFLLFWRVSLPLPPGKEVRAKNPEIASEIGRILIVIYLLVFFALCYVIWVVALN